jgi:mRNA interferase MazF
MEANQYQIVLVSLYESAGTKTEKTNPCVVISPDEMNKFLRTITIAPLTQNPAGYPTRIKTGQKNKISRIAIDQITTIEKSAIVKVLGELSASEIKKIKAVLKEIFVD